MYIDEKLIKILEPHIGEMIDVSYAISLIKTIAKEHEIEQLRIGGVSYCNCKIPDPRMKNSENGISGYCVKCVKPL